MIIFKKALMSQFYHKIQKVSIVLGFFYFMSQSSIKTLFVKAHKPISIPLIKEQLNNSAIALQINANNPVEDKYLLKPLEDNKGLMMAVFDGHGGAQLSQFANERIHAYYSEEYALAPDCSTEEEKVVQSLSNAIQKIEGDFYTEAVKLYKEGKGRAATVGSCALIAIVKGDRLYVANLGDSKAKMFSISAEPQSSLYSVTNLSTTFNSRKRFEQERLKKEFTDENIVVCRHPKVCYVKGRLQPTRSLGDFHLKYSEFNEHQLTKDNSTQYKKEIKGITKPYISSIPDIKVFELTPRDKWVLLASDGLWDFLKSKEAANSLEQFLANNHQIEKISESLIHEVLSKAAKENQLTLEGLLNIPTGRVRRNLHDDITLMLLALNNTKH